MFKYRVTSVHETPLLCLEENQQAMKVDFYVKQKHNNKLRFQIVSVHMSHSLNLLGSFFADIWLSQLIQWHT